jgi:hypothetical protein
MHLLLILLNMQQKLQEITSVQPLSAGIFLENRGGRTLKTAKA